jgi:hypothetical protein
MEEYAMRWWRGRSSLMMGLLLLIGLVSNAWAGPKTEITVTGKLIRVMAIGAETTGWALDLDEPRQIGGKKVTRLEIDPAGTKVGDFENRRIEVAGILEKRSGIERRDYWVIMVKKIRGFAN